MSTSNWWWLSSTSMTLGVKTEGGVIVKAPPIIKKFIGQPLRNLVHWMKRQGGFKIAKG